MPRILLIDDDAQLGPPLAAYLARFDMALECASSPAKGWRAYAWGAWTLPFWM